MLSNIEQIMEYLKPKFYLLIFFIFCILLGIALAKYYDSPLLVVTSLGILALAAFSRLEYALYLLMLSLPFSFRYILPSKSSELQMPTEPLLGVMAVAYFVRQLILRVSSKQKLVTEESESQDGFPFILPLSAYTFSNLLSLINSPDLYTSAKGVARVLAYITLSLIVYDVVRSKKELKRLFIASLPAAAIAVFWTTIVLIAHLDIWRWTSAYKGTLFTNYSIYGAFTAAFFLLLFSRIIFDKKPYDKLIWGIFLTIFGLGLCLCFSRGVWLSVIIGIMFLLFQRTGDIPHKKILIAGGFGVFVLAIISIPGISDVVIERIETIFSKDFASNKSRLLRWGEAYRMFRQQPIIGNGYGSFGIMYKSKIALVGKISQFQLGAHSEYFQTLAETGILGFASWMFLIVSFFTYGMRQLRDIEDSFYGSLIIGLMASELSLLVNFSVISALDADRTGILFWCIYGLLPAICRISRESRKPEVKRAALLVT